MLNYKDLDYVQKVRWSNEIDFHTEAYQMLYGVNESKMDSIHGKYRSVELYSIKITTRYNIIPKDVPQNNQNYWIEKRFETAMSLKTLCNLIELK